jgi:hypothetical protein
MNRCEVCLVMSLVSTDECAVFPVGLPSCCVDGLLE